MSSAKACLSASLVMALPPYFTTMTLPWYFFSHGRAIASVAALSVACFQSSGTPEVGGRVVVGGVAIFSHEEYAEFSWT